MRRYVSVLLAAGLSGCTGFGELLDHTFSNPGRDPNIPMTDNENVRRVRGFDPAIQPLEVEPGNVDFNNNLIPDGGTERANFNALC